MFKSNLKKAVVLLLVGTMTLSTVAGLSGCNKKDDDKDKIITTTKSDTTKNEDTGKDDGEETTTPDNGTTENPTAEGETTVEGETTTTGGSEAGTTTNNAGNNSTEETTTKKNNTTTPTTKPSGNQGSSTVVEGVTDFGVADPSGSLTKITSHVTVHDPSIEYDPSTGKWYIMGSHKAFAQTSDLMKWSYATSNGSSTYHTVFAQSAQWSKLGGTQGQSQYKIDGNLWAPDIIYNTSMKKWCMYMSVNGDNYYSSIAMATADKITGPYTYQGTVVWSGFDNAAQAAQTDYAKVTGSNNVASRYLKNGSWNSAYGTNAIDPCVLYDEDGQLWMVYGSWFGGTFILKLDNKTGLRDYSYTYPLDTNASDGVASDPYLGRRISGGFGGTGEGPYIVWDKDAGYYYLYLSYCGLNATDSFGGYQMRLFRSKNIDGPYTDAAGRYANRTSGSDNQSVKGIKLIGNYYFSSLAGSTSNGKNGYMSPGHNSAIVDNNGNRYVIFHTRFNLGNEWHEVRVHQQFLNEDGWLVTAPYEYAGSKISKSGYKTSDIVGEYEFINHGNDATTGLIGMLPTSVVKLNSDGTISGDVTGTWKQKSGSYFATMVIDGVTYKGVFFKQFDESSSHKETMTFSLIGKNNLAIWGSKVTADAAETGKIVAEYKFDDSASAGKDSVGTVGNATVNGATVVDDATRGKVLSFDGTDDFVQLPAAASEFKGYTIMMWVKSTNANMWERVFDLGDNTDNNMFFTSYAYASGFRFAQKYNGGTETMVSGDSALPKNTWTHVAVTVNSTSKRATVYINGERVGSTILSVLPEKFSGSTNYLGKSHYDDPYFAGYMDDVRIFNYALSEAEVNTYKNK